MLILKGMNKVKSGDHTDSINSLLYLAMGHMPKECKVTENNGACGSLFVLFIVGCYLAWLICFKDFLHGVRSSLLCT